VIARCKSSDWPHLLTPEKYHLPPARMPSGDERVLHIALRGTLNLKVGLSRALRAMGVLREVEWNNTPIEKRRDKIMAAAKEIKPTVVLMQLERGGTAVTPQLVRDLREISADGCVVVDWKEDQHHDPWQSESEWFVELGRECDVSLMTNTAHSEEFAERGVKCPGYWQTAVDCDLWRPDCEIWPDAPKIVFLGSYYGGTEALYVAYRYRNTMLSHVAEEFATDFGVYGFGWRLSEIIHYPTLSNADESRVYQGAQAALSISMRNDLPRYTSDRLFRMLASGAMCLVEWFPGCEDLGLEGGVNCVLWRGEEDLMKMIRLVLSWDVTHTSHMRAAARQLAVDQHDWPVRVSELQAIVDGAREARRAM
jgi:hypothetical protein